MKKKKTYERTCFSPEVLEEARTLLSCPLKDAQPTSASVEFRGEKWYHDLKEECYADIRKEIDYYYYYVSAEAYGIEVTYFGPYSTAEVKAPTRSEVEEIFSCFERGAPHCIVPISSAEAGKPESDRPVVFIGHGRSPQWKELKDHLREQHGYPVEAYEIGARAGHAIRDILEEMLEKSSFAILVMTAEDRVRKAHMRARQNVVHELGLFQGRLGFSRAIILLERGVEGFSNMQGIHQILFSKRNIKETFGDVLATLKREFAQSERDIEEE